MHVRQITPGTWRVWINHGGQTRTVTAATRKAAMMEAAEIMLGMKEAGAGIGGKITVLELLTHHIAAKAPDLSPTTLAEYMRVIDRLDDDFGDKLIRNLRAPDLSAHYTQCLRNGWSVGSVRRLHELMHSAWKHTAIYRWWAVINPASSARPPKRPPHVIVPPDRPTLAALFAAADDQLRLYLRLSANTGARRGELVGLRWSDIEFATGELRIFRSVVYTAESGVVERPTKTGKSGQRRISLSDKLVPLLQVHRESQRTRLGNIEPEYLFSYTCGIDHWFPNTPTELFGRLKKQTGINGVRLHDLRHFAATQMLASGQTPTQVAGRLGHKDARTTMSTYAHWIPATDRTAANDLDVDF